MSEAIADPQGPDLPVARMDLPTFEALDILKFGADVDSQLIGQRLATIAFFRDVRTTLPAVLLSFEGVPGVRSGLGLLISPRPLPARPWCTIDAILTDVGLSSIHYVRPDEAPIASDPAAAQMATPGDSVGELRAIGLTLAAAIGTLLEPGLLTAARRREVADSLKPFLAIVEATIIAELARQQAEGGGAA